MSQVSNSHFVLSQYSLLLKLFVAGTYFLVVFRLEKMNQPLTKHQRRMKSSKTIDYLCEPPSELGKSVSLKLRIVHCLQTIMIYNFNASLYFMV